MTVKDLARQVVLFNDPFVIAQFSRRFVSSHDNWDAKELFFEAASAAGLGNHWGVIETG